VSSYSAVQQNQSIAHRVPKRQPQLMQAQTPTIGLLALPTSSAPPNYVQQIEAFKAAILLNFDPQALIIGYPRIYGFLLHYAARTVGYDLYLPTEDHGCNWPIPEGVALEAAKQQAQRTIYTSQGPINSRVMEAYTKQFRSATDVIVLAADPRHRLYRFYETTLQPHWIYNLPTKQLIQRV